MSTRKLQQEFDKTNKKIAEGLSIFDDIFDKLMTTEISSQKEKLESDLKKEIKKLQRSRDQLKQWLGDGSIKLDKNLLQDNRTKIEHAMDQFKDLEKSSKIKQFSNEGLELQSQQRRFNKFGEAEDAKRQEAFNYLSDIIDQIQQQNDNFEQEVNGLTASLKKAKSSNIYSIQSQIDDMKYKMERNNNHIERIETILNNLDNEKLDPNKVDDIKDDLEYYVENNQEEDYVEYDDFYDQLDIEDTEIEVHGSLSQMAVDPSEYEPKLPEQVAAAGNAPITPSKNDNVTKTVSNTSTGSGSAITTAAVASASGITSNAASAVTTPTKKVIKPAMVPLVSTTTTTTTNNELKEGTPQPDYIHDNSLNKLRNLFQSRIRKPLPYSTVSQMLEVSLNNCPDSQDSDKPRQYNPQTIHPSSVDYPQEPMFELTSSNIFKKFDNDTLFFCFYYSDRKDQISRYNAAKELSNRGWIFNNELKQWFQREEKKNLKLKINDDDELKENNYKYFDYEKTWLTRRRENYIFAKELRETF
ncbi:negative transcriptional regulator [Scheffersomyces coipomensis]|uniref:negative transcriptional regulator n=1 Tax=Scheffersomyces coipomensis TaxID=1788519 RepID=UPI00315DFEE4